VEYIGEPGCEDVSWIDLVSHDGVQCLSFD